MTGEELSIAMEKIFEAGALDVYFTPIFMKKNRPAVKLGVIAKKSNLDDVIYSILKWTSTIGIRMVDLNRVEMERKKDDVEVDGKKINIKISSYKDIRRIKAEAEDIKKYIS
ncbi:nickel insertion protein [Caldicellulosiruptoraceae bacterium PP1]